MLTNIYNLNNIRYIVLSILFGIGSLHANSYRKYPHVKKFYKEITPIALEVAQKYELPAASILAIAGLESGYGRGYVCQITGNIMSLGAFKSDPELPALTLPYSKSQKKILFDENEIVKFSKKDLIFKKRKKSLKKDYRPTPFAGTCKNLTLLKYNKQLKHNAHKACLNDFATKWISTESNIKTFRDAKIWLKSLIMKKNNDILFSMKVNKAFIEKIGGIKNSFNYRKSWPKKVKTIMVNVGLIELVNDMQNGNMNFEQAWEHQ